MPSGADQRKLTARALAAASGMETNRPPLRCWGGRPFRTCASGAVRSKPFEPAVDKGTGMGLAAHARLGKARVLRLSQQ
jgi:hypothetical protein